MNRSWKKGVANKYFSKIESLLASALHFGLHEKENK